MKKYILLLFTSIFAFSILFVIMPKYNVKAVDNEISVAEIFSDNMVLQRNKPVKIFGSAVSNGINVTVNYRNQNITTTTNNGNWMVTLLPMEANSVGEEMKITTSTQSFTFKNVVVGEVWLCSGQSNMELPIINVAYTEYREHYSNYNKIRIFNVPNGVSDNKTEILSASSKWIQPNSLNDIYYYSAFACGFALSLSDCLENIPIGIIESDTSGSCIEEWMGIKQIEETGSNASSMNKEDIKRYNQMIYPLTPYTLGGFLWYQGEANDAWPELYRQQFIELAKQYREEFNYMPIISVQLPIYGNQKWQKFRQMQWNLMNDIEDLYVVCGIDLGLKSDIHPLDKYEFSKRAADIAKSKIYGLDGYNGLSAYPESAIGNNGVVTLEFNDAESGFYVKDNVITNFELCGSNGIYYSASAEIDENKIKIFSENVLVPVKIRYAYSATPDITLFTNNGLPVAPFIMDISCEYVNVTISSGEGGSIVTSSSLVKVKGEQIEFQIIEDEGYIIDTLTWNNENVDVVNNKFSEVVLEDSEVKITFRKMNTFNISIDIDGKGYANSDKNNVYEGETATIYLVSENGYLIKNVKINNVDVSIKDNKIVIEDIQKDIKVDVVFVKNVGCSSSIGSHNLFYSICCLSGIIMTYSIFKKNKRI